MERRPYERHREPGRGYDHFYHRHYRDRRDLDFDEFLRLMLLRELVDRDCDGPECRYHR